MIKWKEKTQKQKLFTVFSLLITAALVGVFIYSMITPDFFWTTNEDGLHFYKKRILFMFLVTAFGIFTCFGSLPVDEKKKKIISFLIYILTPVVVFLLMEYNNPAGPSLIWRKLTFVSIGRSVITLILLYMLTAVLFTVTNSMRFTGCFLCVFALIFIIGNYFVNNFRGSPILASDLATIGTAMNVAADYQYTLDYSRIVFIECLVIWCMLLFRIKKLKITAVRTRIKCTAVSLATFTVTMWVLLYTPMMLNTMHIMLNTFRPINSYQNNGGILTFLRSLQLMIVEEPDGYSIQAVEDIADPYRQEAAAADDDFKKPNVIVVMDEAFADLQEICDFETSEEIMPFYDSLTENTVKGSIYVSVFGGQTANTEFEFLTGLSKAFLPTASTPYQMYIRKPLPGLTSFLSEQDYGGMLAFHPYYETGYNRHNVYPLLGFKDYISIEDMTVLPEHAMRNRVSDQHDFEIIIEEYEKAKAQSDAPFYLFNVTMQNHSSYDTDFDNFPQPLTIEPKYDNAKARRYLNLVRHSDTALKTLIDYFEKEEEPTVVVFFGDHEPGLSDKYYSKLFGKDINTLTDEENLEMYRTPFLIWANYDIEEQEDVTISSNYLSTLMLENTGMKLSAFNYFLSDMAKEVPVLTAHGYYGNDGNYYTLSDTSSPYYEKLQTYNMLQYNNLFDSKRRISDFFD